MNSQAYLMDYFVGVTDNSWFDFLSKLQPDEVNFWRPSGKNFQAIPIGAPFLFKLHSPLNYIAGGGFFVRSEQLPLSLAWEAFSEKNGAASYSELMNLIRSHRPGKEINPQIGCVILNEPFFLPKEKWIPVPEDWSHNIVIGKTYNTSNSIGAQLWDDVMRQLSVSSYMKNRISDVRELYGANAEIIGRQYLIKSRLGQGAFRILVTGAYFRRCAISGEKTLPVLEAAHIKPHAESGPNRIDNGVLLRSDLHKLFDKGYLTVTPDLHVEVSQKIKEEFDNGKNYYPFHGNKLLILPRQAYEKPNREYLEWHNSHIYLG